MYNDDGLLFNYIELAGRIVVQAALDASGHTDCEAFDRLSAEAFLEAADFTEQQIAAIVEGYFLSIQRNAKRNAKRHSANPPRQMRRAA